MLSFFLCVREQLKINAIVLLLFPNYSFALCDWTPETLIVNSEKITFQECQSEKKIRVNGITIRPNIEFKIVHEHFPEGNTIWSKLSPDGNTALVWLENSNYKRELWVIDLTTNEVSYSLVSINEGRHFLPKFSGNNDFIIVTAGIGYKQEVVYSKISNTWKRQSKQSH